MSDYRRFVSYIYNYEAKIKKNNVGFARIEVRGNQCKMTIHMQVKSISSGTLKAYGFVRDGNYLKGIFLEELVIKNGGGDAQIILDKEDIKGSGSNFKDLGGLIFYVSNDKYFGTEWDDIPLVFEQLIIDNGKTGIIREMNRESIKTQKRGEVQKSRPLETVTDTGEKAEPEEQREGRKEDGTEAIREETKTEAKTETGAGQQEMEEILKAAALPQPIFSPCTPKELKGRFGYEMKNDFVMHGYNRFGHLGIMEVKDNHFVGVPGIFCKREQTVAENYGYGNFCPRTGGQLHYGDFGYWYDSMEYLR